MKKIVDNDGHQTAVRAALTIYMVGTIVRGIH